MKETLEEYIFKNFYMGKGSILELRHDMLCGFINGVKWVSVKAIRRNCVDSSYTLSCEDEIGHVYTCCASIVYWNKLDTVASRLLYLK